MKLKLKVTTPRFKKQQRLEVFESDPRLVYEIAERVALNNAYSAGSNYTFAREGKVLDPESRFVDVVQDEDKLALVIR